MITRISFIALLVVIFGCNTETKQQDLSTQSTTNDMKNPGSVEFINPDSLHKNPAFSQLAVVSGNVKTVYIGGQDAVDAEGKVVGKGDIEKQSQQVLKNLELALKAGGAGFEHVVKWNIYIVKGQNAQNALKPFQPMLKKLKSPPLVTGITVESLANPDYLLEVEAIAVVPE